jgi:hypothetical protein
MKKKSDPSSDDAHECATSQHEEAYPVGAVADSEHISPPHHSDLPSQEEQQERARRLGVEVARLSRLPAFEWPLYLEETANRYGVEPTKLKQMVEATIRENEKKEREG